MMLRIYSLSLMFLLVGCASNQEQAAELPKKFSVTQNDMHGSAAYEACVTCPSHSKKVIAIPPKPQSEVPKVLDAQPANIPEPGVPPRKVIVNVFFGYGMSAVDNKAAGELAGVVDQISKAKHIVIAGYTDPRGSRAMNLKLARKRALSVERYLISKGMTPDAAQIVIPDDCCTGNPNATSREHDKSRRAQVEVLIIK